MRRTTRNSGRKEYELIGQILKELRLAKGYTQRRLADEFGFAHSKIARIEQGLQVVDILTLIDLAKALGSTGSEILEQVEHIKKCG